MTMSVDKMTTPSREVSQLFRVPSPMERQLGLWVDRVGQKRDENIPDGLRVLGLYGCVAVTEGSGVFRVEQQPDRAVAAGDAMLLFPGVAHRYGAPGASWSTQWVVFGGATARVLQDMGLLDPQRPVVHDAMGALSQACATLSPLMQLSDSRSCLRRHNIICGLVLALAESRDAVTATAPREEVLAGLVAYLDEHFREDIRPAELARRFALSYTHLRRLFRMRHGHGIKEYITQKRLSLAKHVLSEKRHSLKHVAAMVGYDDPRYFMRLFKARVGVTAGRFV